MKLKSEYIYLRPLHVNDAEGSYPSWLNDKEVCQYNSHGDMLYTKEMALSYIQSVENNPTCNIVFSDFTIRPYVIKKNLDDDITLIKTWKSKKKLPMDVL